MLLEDYRTLKDQRKDYSPRTKAAKEAKKLGLVYYGFGRFGNPKTGQITHKVENNELVKIKFNWETRQHEKDKKDVIDAHEKFYSSMSKTTDSTHRSLSKYYKITNTKDQNIIDNYCSDGYSEINKYLLGKNDNKALKKKVKELDNLLDSHQLPTNIIAYTGIRTKAFPEGLKTNKTYQIKPYKSTSLDYNIALGFFNDDDNSSTPIIIQFNLKKGQKGFYVGDNSRHEEKEFIIPRNIKFQVTDEIYVPKTDKGDAHKVYVADIVND